MAFVDCVAMKRYLTKCGLKPTDNQIFAIIRRIDIDADAKLSRSEFDEAITPQEVFMKCHSNKPERPKKRRPQIVSCNNLYVMTRVPSVKR